MEENNRRWLRVVLTALAALTIGVAGTWASLTILQPAEDPDKASTATYVEVAPGEVGASLVLNAVAEWPQVSVGSNQATGIVTEVIIGAGSEVTQGTALYSVNLRPVVAAEGETPMFREISEGTVGADVIQLQEMLAALGFYRDGIDGKVEQRTIAAIKRWQEALGIEATGVVEAGDVVFLPSLPMRLVLDPELVRRGSTLSGGEAVISGLPAVPEFVVPVSEGQAAMMPSGTPVRLTSPSGQEWQGVAGEQKRNEDDGTVSVAVRGGSEDALCLSFCDEIPISGQTTLTARIVTVQQVTGLTVPSAALVTSAEGNTAVINAEEELVPVEVVASAKGMSIITGVPEGLRVRIPGGDESTD